MPWDFRLIGVLVILIAVLAASAHALRIAPIAGRQWRWVWMTLVFLVWLLAGFRSLR